MIQPFTPLRAAECRVTVRLVCSLSVSLDSRLLNSVARVFAKFPSQEVAMELALQTLPHCAASFPKQTPPVLTEVQMNALEALSDFDFAVNPLLIAPAMRFITILWTMYSSSLPASCNMKHFGRFTVAALDPDIGEGGRVREAINCSKDFVSSLMRVLSDSQIKALEKEGVYKQLRLLMMRYDEMSADDLKQIVIGVGTFAEVTTGSAMAFLEENSYLGFVHTAIKYPADEAIQVLVWQLFAVLCKSDKKFAEGLLQTDLLSSVLTLLQGGVQPPLKFLMVCCQVSPLCISSCLGNQALIDHVLSMLSSVTVDASEQAAEPLPDRVVLCLCEFLAALCRSEPANVASILNYQIISHLEECARTKPEVGLLQACIAIEGIVNSFPPSSMVIPGVEKLLDSFMAQRVLFCSRDHHLFFKDMLSHKLVSSEPQLIKLMYITLQKLLRAFTPDAMAKVHTKEFLEFFTLCFIRDTMAFPSLVVRIVFTTHYFIFEMRNKESISFLNELSFHVTIAGLMQSSVRGDDIATIMGLLACLVGKYYEFLKDVKPFLKAEVPDILLDKAKVFGSQAGRNAQFCEDFGRIMLNMTADKELSQELYEQGYLKRLVELLGEKGLSDVRRSMIHAIGNIALGGQNIKQVLLDQHFYLKLLSILRTEGKVSDPFLVSACCRVLHVLASGDWAKRKFVECGCVEVLLDVMRVRKDNVEIRWRPLGLLSSLGFMAVTNRRYVLTDDVLDVVASILKESKNGKVISYTTLVFLGIDELDQGARRLRELGIGEYLQDAIDKTEYRKQAPDLERWGIHVMEKQNLYTITSNGSSQDPIPQPCSNHPSDWPPCIPLESPETETNSDGISDASVVRRLLPLNDSSFKSYTPLAPELTPSLHARLGQLGLDPTRPLFRIGRVYGSTHGLCSNCDKESASEELVIRPLGMTVEQYQYLIDDGWYRRGGVKMFRLRQNHNMECCDWETRVLASEFDHKSHKSYKKVLRRMPVDRLTVETVPAGFDRDAFDLYNEYHTKKHDKPLKSEHSYCEHVANTPTSYQSVEGVDCGTYHQLYRLDGKLVAIGIVDIVPRGLVSIYMWYSTAKEVSKYSFGVYSALKEIELVKELSKKNPQMKYYYLQGWNGNNKKLNYKANYEPEEFYCPCIVPGWVSSLGGVAEAKNKMTEEKRIAKQKAEDEEPEKMVTDSSEPGEGSDEKQSLSRSKSKDESVTGDAVTPPVHIECRAFPMDQRRYKQLTGESEVDIRKLVICLNYSHYMYLEDLFQRYEVGPNQRDTMECRFKELVVAISPELRSQLVIDMMASQPSQQ